MDTDVYLIEPGSASAPLGPPPPIAKKEPLIINAKKDFYWPDVFSATQPSMSKHWREQKH